MIFRQFASRRWVLVLFCVLASFVQPSRVLAGSECQAVQSGYRDFSFGLSGLGSPTREKPESKLWFNDGWWWGSLYNRNTEAYHIYSFNPQTQCWTDTATPIDERNSSAADALWDEASQKLYVASHVFSNIGEAGSDANSARLYRFTYHQASRSYTLDPGFPVKVNQGKSEALVLAKDSTGRLWVTYVQEGKVMVNHSLSNDLQWGTPYVLPVKNNQVSTDDISSIIAFGGNAVGIFWSNQTLNKFHFAIHRDGDSDLSWQQENIGVPGPPFGESSDDHLNLKSLQADNSGRIFAAVKTSLTASSAPLVMLLVRDPTSSWSSHVFGRKSDHHTRPIVLIDDENSRLYMFATAPEAGGAIYGKRADLQNIQFSDGLGEPFIQSSLDLNVNNATSTKQNLNSTTGLLVLASDKDSRYYLHSYLSLSPTFQLQVQTNGSGTVAVDPKMERYPAGTAVSLTAQPSSGYQFSGWSGDLSGSANPASLTMDSNKTVTAQFTQVQTQYRLTVTIVGSGNVILDPPGGVYAENTVVTLKAEPSAGYVFSGWSGDLTGTAETVMLNMNSDKNVTATFSLASGAVRFEEIQSGTAAESSAVTTALALRGGTSQLYLAAVSSRPNIPVTSVSGLGLQWTHVKTQCSGRDQTGISVWMAQGAPGADGKVTATLSSAVTSAVLVVSRYSGADTSNPIVQTSSANTSGVNGTCTSGVDNSSYSFPLSVAHPNARVFAAAAMRHRTHTPGADYVERAEVHEGSSGTVASVAIADRSVASPSTIFVDGSFSGTVDWAVVALEIKPQQ